jgi:hypothetical protein
MYKTGHRRMVGVEQMLHSDAANQGKASATAPEKQKTSVG